MNNEIIITDIPFIKDFIDLILSIPKYYLVFKEKNIVGLKEYFESQLLELRDTYSTILEDTTSESIKIKISKLSYAEKDDLASYFSIKSHLNSKVTPGMKSFCKTLNLPTHSTKSLYEFLIGSTNITSKRLEFNYTIQCPACKNYILISIKCKSSSGYEPTKICCNTCQHNFELVVNGRLSYNYNKYLNCNCSFCRNSYDNMIFHVQNNANDFINSSLQLIKEVDKANTTLSLEQKFKIHKNSLTKTETELLNLHPKSYEEIHLLLDEMLSRYPNSTRKSKIINDLIKHGILYNQILEDKLITIIEGILDKFCRFKDKLIENTWDELRISSCIHYKETNSITPLSFDLYSWNDSPPFIHFSLSEITLTDCYDLKLNSLYFNNISDKSVSTNKSYRIFGSDAECTLYNSLKRTYPNDFIIIPNACLHSITNLSIIKSNFTNKDYLYLKTCRLDFLITDSDGYIIEAVELQKGKHHDKKEWIYKDTLKRVALKLLGIPLVEEY